MESNDYEENGIIDCLPFYAFTIGGTEESGRHCERAGLGEGLSVWRLLVGGC
jgi:hypothetical protein